MVRTSSIARIRMTVRSAMPRARAADRLAETGRACMGKSPRGGKPGKTGAHGHAPSWHGIRDREHVLEPDAVAPGFGGAVDGAVGVVVAAVRFQFAGDRDDLGQRIVEAV